MNYWSILDIWNPRHYKSSKIVSLSPFYLFNLLSVCNFQNIDEPKRNHNRISQKTSSIDKVMDMKIKIEHVKWEARPHFILKVKEFFIINKLILFLNIWKYIQYIFGPIIQIASSNEERNRFCCINK